MKIEIRGLEESFIELTNKIEEEGMKIVGNTSESLLSELVAATPIDTGRARSGWNLSKNKDNIKIENDVPYINALNHGHSQQAPTHFVERIALKYGKPLGAIVTVKS
jgi:hypothetical protein